MNRERVDQWCERGILGLVMAILAIGPLATGSVRTLEFLSLQGLTIGVLVLWVARMWLGGHPRLLWPPIAWAVMAFTVFAIWRYGRADIEYLARQELIHIVVYAFLFLAIVNHLHRQDSIQILVYFVVFLGMAISLYAIYQFASGSQHIWNITKPAQYAGRASGTFICPNHLAGYLEMLLPLALSFLFLGRGKHVTRILFGYAALVILGGIGVSVSRGGWAATGLALAVFFALLLRDRAHRLPAILSLVALVAAGVVFARQNFSTQRRMQLTSPNGGLDVRFELWKPAAQIWRDNIWIGAGPAHFDSRFHQYRPESVQMRPEYAHNDYLNTLADWGLIGAGLIASAWVFLYLGVFRCWKFVQRGSNQLQSRGSNRAALVMGSSIGLLALLLHSVVDFNFHIPSNAMLAIALMAMLSSHLRFASDRYWVSRNGWVRLLATLACLGGGTYLCLQGLQRYHEHMALEHAKGMKTYGGRIAAYERAHKIEPKNSKTTYQIGELLRLQSWQGNDDYKDLATEAISWFERTIKLNRWDCYAYMRLGMCLDWLMRFDEAKTYIHRASELDSNNYYILALQGWHWVQVGSDAQKQSDFDKARSCYATAKSLLERSKNLRMNNIAVPYLSVLERKMAELSASK